MQDFKYLLNALQMIYEEGNICNSVVGPQENSTGHLSVKSVRNSCIFDQKSLVLVLVVVFMSLHV